jgi:hypothetical protein
MSAPVPLEHWYLGGFEEEERDYLEENSKPLGVVCSVQGQFVKGSDHEWSIMHCGDGSDQDPGNIFRMKLAVTKPEGFAGLNYFVIPNDGTNNRDDDSAYAMVVDESMPMGDVQPWETAEWLFTPVPVPKAKKGEKEPKASDYEHVYRIRVGKHSFNQQVENAVLCVRTNLKKDKYGDDKARVCITNPYKWPVSSKVEWKLEPGSSKDMWKIKVKNMPEAEEMKGWYVTAQRLQEDIPTGSLGRTIITVQDPEIWSPASQAEWKFEKGSDKDSWKITLGYMPLRTRAQGGYLTATPVKDSMYGEDGKMLYVSVQDPIRHSAAASAEWELIPAEVEEASTIGF